MPREGLDCEKKKLFFIARLVFHAIPLLWAFTTRWGAIINKLGEMMTDTENIYNFPDEFSL